MKIHRKILTFVGIFTVLLIALLSQGCAEDSCLPCEQAAEQFLAQLQGGETREAYTWLTGKLPLPASEERLNALVNASNVQLKRYGNPEGFELVKANPRGSRVTTLTYFFYQPTRVSRWNFEFYKVDGQWVLMNFAAGDEVTQFW